MEDGIPGWCWYDYLPIGDHEKQRIAELHRENWRLEKIAFVTSVAAVVSIAVLVTRVTHLW